ncbi:hypothetical protein HGH93_05975 [Chitinophaga polysaccharea]|uniref:hypothetical protein n=1 Tax=Chitinophaga polysaccharea TaxID=1293035 RepID=UPI001455AD2B|nr:hypothetical protein [Chitinophaga polysaccharea]NLR57636.1 hypothetical protein [Chitinophaga polysaccharea]
MVSLDERIPLLQALNGDNKLHAFWSLLINKPIDFQLAADNDSEVDQVYFGCIKAIIADNKPEFELHFNRLARRSPTRDDPPPFVFDDLLIYTILVGSCMFGVGKEWLGNILRIRPSSPSTITFQNLLNVDVNRYDSLQFVVVPFLHRKNRSVISNEMLNNALNEITSDPSLFTGNNLFAALLAMRCYNLIISMKEYGKNPLDLQFLEYKPIFLRRIKIVARFSLAILVFCLVHFLVLFLKNYPSLKAAAESYNTIAGLLGAGVASLFPKLVQGWSKVILHLVGYPKSLLESVNTD